MIPVAERCKSICSIKHRNNDHSRTPGCLFVMWCALLCSTDDRFSPLAGCSDCQWLHHCSSTLMQSGPAQCHTHSRCESSPQVDLQGPALGGLCDSWRLQSHTCSQACTHFACVVGATAAAFAVCCRPWERHDDHQAAAVKVLAVQECDNHGAHLCCAPVAAAGAPVCADTIRPRPTGSGHTGLCHLECEPCGVEGLAGHSATHVEPAVSCPADTAVLLDAVQNMLQGGKATAQCCCVWCTQSPTLPAPSTNG